MRVASPAKINLDLHVGPPRADGFHPVRTWMVAVGLYDTIEFSPANQLSLTCDDPTIPTDSRNLVWQAAELLGRGDVAIRLTKQIPAGGGLGGGSSNAAATLMALNRFWKLGHDVDFLSALAARLGSDVPFFLHGPSSLCEGRGEIITPVPLPACRWVVLILPGIAMPTPAVYRRLDELRQGEPDLFSRPAKALPAATDALSLLPRLVNDLERPAFHLSPTLAALRAACQETLARPVRQSGSGSTLFTLYDDGASANAASEAIYKQYAVRSVAAPIGQNIDAT